MLCTYCKNPIPEAGEGLEALELQPGRVFCPRCGAEMKEVGDED